MSSMPMSSNLRSWKSNCCTEPHDRVYRVRGCFMLAALLYGAAAHAQFLFNTDKGARVMRRIVQFLQARD